MPGSPPAGETRSASKRRYRTALPAAVSALLGAVVLFGWAAGWPAVTQIIPGRPATQPLSAISLILAGLALHLYERRRFHAAAVPLAAMALISGGNLLEYTTGLSLGIDTLLFRKSVITQAGSAFPGRIYPLSAIGYLIFCLCLALPRQTPRRYRRVGKVASAGFALSFANLSGYLLNAEGFAESGDFATMAAPTAIGLTLLFGAILHIQQGRTWLQLFYPRHPTPGSRMAGNLAPLILGWPLVVGLIFNLFTPSFGDQHRNLAITLVCVVAVQAALLLRFTRRFERTESERLAAEAALRESRERYRIVVETAIEGIVTIDQRGNIVFANPAAAAIFGYTVAEMQAGNLSMLMPEAARSVYRTSFADYLSTGRRHMPWTGTEVSGLHRSGREIPLEVSYGEYRRDGEPLFIGIVRDIGERRRAEAALRELNQNLEVRVRERTAELWRSNEALMRSNLELQRFTYVAAHDLQTPLRSISSFVQLLEQNYRGRLDKRADEWIRLVVDNTHRLQALISESLAYLRVDSQALPFAPTDLGQVFDEVVATLAGPIRATQAEVSRGELPVVMGDRMQLSQVLQNLIDNAIKYHGDAPPRVHVSAQRQDGEWLFAVRDNGIGIAEQHHASIFEVFGRLHTAHAYPGTGIGLAVCRRIIYRHGGRIWVESEPGKGSTFYFTLPTGGALS